MNTRLQALAIGSLIIALSPLALSQPIDTQDIYFGGFLGQDNSASSRNMTNPVVGGATLGYQVTRNYALQTNFLSIRPDNKTTNQNVPGNLLSAEAVFSVAPTPIFRPYVSAGAGLLKLEYSRFVWDGGLGTRFLVAPQTSFGLDFRYLYQPSTHQSDQIYGASLRYNFGDVDNLNMAAFEQEGFKSKKQVEDYVRNTYRLPAGIERCSDASATQPICATLNGNHMTMKMDVKFNINKASIQGNYTRSLDLFSKFLKEYPNLTATIQGYASKEGPKRFNQWLSQQRADKVVDYISKDGIANTRLTAEGMGTANPVANNNTKWGRALNRRVSAEITVPLKPTMARGVAVANANNTQVASNTQQSNPEPQSAF